MTERKGALRTIHLTTSLERDQGGPPVSVFNYSACSLAAGIRAEIATTFNSRFHESSVQPQIEELGTRVFAFQRSSLFGKYAKRWGISFSLLWWILRKARDYDIILIHGGWSFSSVSGLLAARIARRPCILVPHESLTRYDVTRRGSVIRIVMKSLLRMAYWRYCELLIFSSRLERRDSSAGREKARSAVLPHPIYDDRVGHSCPTPDIKRRLRRVGYIGRLHQKKNVPLVISALSQLSQHVSLTIAGDGPDEVKRPLLELAEREGVQERIEWLGFVEGKSKEDFFRQIDVLAMPSEYESFGLVAAEAMVRGIPAVVTARSGIAEVIQEFGGGLVWDPDDGSFAHQLKRFEDDPELLPLLSQQAINTANGRLSFSAFAAGLKQWYLAVVATRQRSELTPGTTN